LHAVTGKQGSLLRHAAELYDIQALRVFGRELFDAVADLVDSHRVDVSGARSLNDELDLIVTSRLVPVFGCVECFGVLLDRATLAVCGCRTSKSATMVAMALRMLDDMPRPEPPKSGSPSPTHEVLSQKPPELLAERLHELPASCREYP
jgi:hypothetical protein